MLRININSSFHKNADGERIYGNRINVFSEQEFLDKGDGKTYYKYYPLPFETIKNTADFLELLDFLLEYINVEDKGKINIKVQGNIV